MKKEARVRRTPEILEEYNFRGGVRGKYVARFQEGSNLVLLAPDVAEVFPDAESVNKALRTLMERPEFRRTPASGES